MGVLHTLLAVLFFFIPKVITQSWDQIIIQATGRTEWMIRQQFRNLPQGPALEAPPSFNLATASWMSSQLHFFQNLSMSLLRVGKKTMPLREKQELPQFKLDSILRWLHGIEWPLVSSLWGHLCSGATHHLAGLWSGPNDVTWRVPSTWYKVSNNSLSPS